MKSSNYLILAFTLFAFLFSGTSMLAQDANKEKKVNTKKELIKIFKELPLEYQMEVFDFAKSQNESVKRMEAAKAAAEVKAKEKAAQAQEIAVSPKQEIPKTQPAPATQPTPVTPQRPQQPARPGYMVEAEDMAPTTVQWYEEVHDFGEIKQGESVTHTFRFKNTGDNPLKLTRVKASCGCTTPKWSKEEVASGEEGFVDVTFNSRGKFGHQTKTVTLWYNGSPITKVLRFKGNIVKPAATPEQKEDGHEGHDH